MDAGDNKYKALEDRIYEIFDHFSFEQNPLEPPNEKQEDLIRAMVVLCHAEFEDYLESLANELLETGREKWVNDGVANKNIASLFLHTEKMRTGENEKPMTTATYAVKTIVDFENQVNRENHGIKTKNIESIYMPLGYTVDMFDQDFLNELDAFGIERGKIAHTSSFRTQNTLDVKTEKEKILRVLKGIKDFEAILRVS